MKSVFLRIVCVVMVLGLAGCTQRGVAGRYLSESDNREYMELKKDNTFVLFQDGRTFTGEYEIRDDTFLLTFHDGHTAKGLIRGDMVTDPDGVRWRKQ